MAPNRDCNFNSHPFSFSHSSSSTSSLSPFTNSIFLPFVLLVFIIFPFLSHVTPRCLLSPPAGTAHLECIILIGPGEGVRLVGLSLLLREEKECPREYRSTIYFHTINTASATLAKGLRALDDLSLSKQAASSTRHFIRLTFILNPLPTSGTPFHTDLDQPSSCPVSLCYRRQLPPVPLDSHDPIMSTSRWGRRGARPFTKSLTILLALLAPTPTVQLSQQLCSTLNTGAGSSVGKSVLRTAYLLCRSY